MFTNEIFITVRGRSLRIERTENRPYGLSSGTLANRLARRRVTVNELNRTVPGAIACALDRSTADGYLSGGSHQLLEPTRLCPEVRTCTVRDCGPVRKRRCGRRVRVHHTDSDSATRSVCWMSILHVEYSILQQRMSPTLCVPPEYVHRTVRRADIRTTSQCRRGELVRLYLLNLCPYIMSRNNSATISRGRRFRSS